MCGRPKVGRPTKPPCVTSVEVRDDTSRRKFLEGVVCAFQVGILGIGTVRVAQISDEISE